MSDKRTNNAIFTQPATQPQPQADDVPHETIPLPSRGLVYPDTSSLHGRAELYIKPMTAREEDILMSPALIKNGTAITALIRSCLIDKSIDPADMIAGDRNALVFAIRISGYGPSYEASIECSECGEKSDRTFDLSTIPINFLDIKPVRDYENRFEFKLPQSGKVVNFRFLTGRSEESSAKTQVARKRAMGSVQVEQSVTDSLRDAIVSIDGVDDRQKIADFARNMLARDSLALRSYIAQHSPDISTKQDSECKSCGFVEEVSIPLGVSFLWPRAKR